MDWFNDHIFSIRTANILYIVSPFLLDNKYIKVA